MPISPTVAAIRDRQRHLLNVLSHVQPHRIRPRSLGKRILALYRTVDLFDPTLVTLEHRVPFTLIAEQPWRRRLWDWNGQGGLRGLMEHLLVGTRYPLPDFLFALPQSHHTWSSVWKEGRTLIRMLIHLGEGGSMRRARDLHLIPSCLTRRMQHQLMVMEGEMSMASAVRRAQIRTLGGPNWMFEALHNTRLAELQPDEPGWQKVIGWMCAGRDDLSTNDMEILVDYLFAITPIERGKLLRQSMARAVLRAEAWHGALGQNRVTVNSGPLPASGLPDGTFESIWSIRQIRTGRELSAEGLELKHCVASYWNSVMSRRCAIFSLKREGMRHLTVEVRLAEGNIVQARGMRNRQPRPDERAVLEKWAACNKLAIQAT